MNTPARKSYNSPRQVERQQRILEAARSEVSRLGYEGLTMRGLADSAGVALKTLYNLYSSKDELLFAAVGGLLEDLRALPEVRDAEPGLPMALSYVRVLADTIVREPAYADAMAQALFKSTAEDRLVEILLRDSVKTMRASLVTACENDELLPTIDIDAVASQMVAVQWGVVMLWQKGLIALPDVPGRMRQSQLPILAAITGDSGWLEGF